MNLQPTLNKDRLLLGSALDFRLAPSIPKGFGAESRAVTRELEKIWKDTRSTPSVISESAMNKSSQSTEELLFEANAQAKILTAQFAMHLSDEQRLKLFRQLDRLLDAGEWMEDEEALKPKSFKTFLRMILYMRPAKQPSLGISPSGNLLAAWLVNDDRLSMEFLPDDKIKWVLSIKIEEEKERAAGESVTARLSEVLEPYKPSRWFNP